MKKTGAFLLAIGMFSVIVFAASALYRIDPSECTQCGLCIENCPDHAISAQTIDGEIIHVIDQKKCTKCGKCIEACPVEAIKNIGEEEPVKVKKADKKKK